MCADVDDTTYGYTDPEFGIPAMTADQELLDTEEARKADLIGRGMAAICELMGAGFVSGGELAIGTDEVTITAARALIRDDLGLCPVKPLAAVIAVGEFAAGVNYVHLQLGDTARADGVCGYYVSQSATPGAEAIVAGKVTVTGGVITAVDNTVKAAPGILARLPWELLQRNADDSTTLLALLTAALGTRYLNGTAPASVDARLTAAEGGGGGIGGAAFWADLGFSAEDATTISQAIATALQAHVTALHQGTGGGTTTGGATAEPWDGEAARQLDGFIRSTAVSDPLYPARMTNIAIYVPGRFGDGTVVGGWTTPDWRATA